MEKLSFARFVHLWNRGQGLGTPRLHVRIACWLERRWRGGDRELLLLAFRNCGKSTLVGLFCAWLLAREPDLRIMVLAADHLLARKMVRNVKRIVERHPAIEALRPRERDQWAADQFTVERPSELRDPSMLARGITSNFTGSRADVVICDDVEVPNTSDTAPKRADLRTRLGEIDYVLVPGGLQLYIGTPHTYYTIYAEAPRTEIGEEAPFLDGFRRLELPVFDARGLSRWPERFPPDKIAAIGRRTGPNKFASQMLLRPVSATDSRLDPDRLRPYHGELEYGEANGRPRLRLEGRTLVSASCWWDPAYGAPDRGDGNVVAVVYTDAEGELWLHRVRYLEVDPSQVDEEPEATQLCRQVADFAKAHFVPQVRVEANGLGAFLPRLLRRELAAAGVACSVRPEFTHTPKDRRILEAFDARLAAGAIRAHCSLWDTPFIREMREWRPGGRGPDDGLDAVAGCLESEPMRFDAPPPLPRRDWRPGAGAIKVPSDFDVL